MITLPKPTQRSIFLSSISALTILGATNSFAKTFKITEEDEAIKKALKENKPIAYVLA